MHQIYELGHSRLEKPIRGHQSKLNARTSSHEGKHWHNTNNNYRWVQDQNKLIACYKI